MKIYYVKILIKGFIAVDKIFKYEWLQTWLVFDFHPFGSLEIFLENNTLKIEEMILMVESISSGLNYLHREVIGANFFKPAMAHRDIKTGNILVKNDSKNFIIRKMLYK